MPNRAQQQARPGIPGHREIRRLGYLSALLVMLWVILFGGTMALGLAGIDTGPFPFLVCLPLAPSFVVMMTAIHCQAPPEKRIWSHLGLAFAVIYAVLVSIVYYVQLTVVRTAGPDLLPFVYTPGTVFFAIDMLGYAFMCLSTWFAAPAFGAGDRLSAWIRRLFILHGLLVFPTLIAPALMPSPTAPAAGGDDLVGYLALLLWCLIFTPLSYLVARFFARMRS